MEALTPEDFTTLRHCILFQDLDPEAVVPLLSGTIHSAPAGQFLLQEGDVVDQVALLLSGTIHASFFGTTGKEFLYQQLLPASLVSGEIVCTPRQISPYSMYAEQNVRLWAFPWALLEDSSPLDLSLRLTLLRNLLAFVANQNLRKYYKIDALSTRSARERILKFLTARAIRARSLTFTITMGREAMANYLCLNRSVLSHELKQMEEDGLLQFRKNQFTLSPQCCPPDWSPESDT